MRTGEVMIICLIAEQIKTTSLYKMSYFPEPCTHSKSKVKVELNLSNYAAKSDLKMQQALVHQNFIGG